MYEGMGWRMVRVRVLRRRSMVRGGFVLELLLVVVVGWRGWVWMSFGVVILREGV